MRNGLKAYHNNCKLFSSPLDSDSFDIIYIFSAILDKVICLVKIQYYSHRTHFLVRARVKISHLSGTRINKILISAVLLHYVSNYDIDTYYAIIILFFIQVNLV